MGKNVGGIISRTFKHLEVLDDIDEMEVWKTGLFDAKKFAWTSSSKILFSDLKTVIRGGKYS